MKRSAIVIVLGQMALQAEAADNVSSAVTTLSPLPFYVGAVVLAVVVAVVISYIARANAHVNLPRTHLTLVDPEIQSSIEQSLLSVTRSREDRARVAQAVGQVVSERVTAKVMEAAEEIKGQYETVLQERGKQQEIIEMKYKNLVMEKNQTEAIVQSLAEGLVVVNNKGQVVMMNPAAEKLLGVDKGKKIGRPLTEGIGEEAFVSVVGDSSGGEKVVEVNSTRQETRRVIRSSSALVENENGQTVGMVSVLTDVTKQKELDQLKTKFVSTVTHELRTPMVATQKALAVVIDEVAGPLTADQKRFLDIANRNMDRLGRLINDILDFSKMEAGKMTLERTPVAISKIIDDACDGLVSWAGAKEITIVKEIDKDLPQCSLDSFRIVQVLNNLLGNALKFTPKGGQITVSARRLGASEIEVSIQDTGIGISKEDLPRVFERFLQVGERKSSDISGTGLGLSIAKEIVELHGGRIWVESEKGQGAKFIFVLASL